MHPLSDIHVRLCFVRPQAAALYTHTTPTKGSPKAAGYDLRACLDEDCVHIKAQERLCIPTGIAIEPVISEEQQSQNIAGFIYARSGLGAKHGLTIAQGTGLIDSDYRGEILVYLLNTSSATYMLRNGERMAQLVFQYVLQAKWEICTHLNESQRGHGGFGHSGKQ